MRNRERKSVARLLRDDIRRRRRRSASSVDVERLSGEGREEILLDPDRSSIRRGVERLREAALPLLWLEIGSTDRHWSLGTWAMWGSRWAITLLYTSVCTRGRHHAGAKTSRRERGKAAARVPAAKEHASHHALSSEAQSARYNRVN